MRWVVNKNEDGTYLIGSTGMPKSDWESLSESDVLRLNEMRGVYGVKDNCISVKGALQNIVDRYMAAVKLSGLGDCIEVNVRRSPDNGFEEVICLEPSDYAKKRIRVYKVPEFVEIIEGMHWFSDKVIFSDSVRCIERGNKEAHLGIGVDSMGSEVILNGNLRRVSSSAFKYSNCSKLTFRGVTGNTRFYFRAFDYATSLKEVEFPEGMTSLTGEVFHSCTSLETVYLPDSLEFMGDACFSQCISLKSLWIPDNVRVKSANFISGHPVKYAVRIPVERWLKVGLEITKLWVERLRFVCMKDCDAARVLLRTMAVSKVAENVFHREDSLIKPVFVLLKDDSREGFEEYLSNYKRSYIEAVKL